MTKHISLCAPFLVALAAACSGEFKLRSCPAGQVPNDTKDECVLCEAGTVADSELGKCVSCEAGQVPNAEGRCVPTGQNPAGSGGSGGQAGAGGAGGTGGAGGMGGSGGAPIDGGTAHLRVVHLSPDAGSLNVCARRHSTDAGAPFDIAIHASAVYKTMTPYVDVPAGALDIRLVQAGEACDAAPVAPDNAGLDPLGEGQYAMLALAGLRTPSAAGGVPPEQALGARLFLDPAPADGAGEPAPWVRFIVFSTKTPALDAGEYEDDPYSSDESFTKEWEPAPYGYAAAPKASGKTHGYRAVLLNHDTQTSIGLSVSPETSTKRPDKILPHFPDLSNYSGGFGGKFDLFMVGQYAGLSALSALWCRTPGPTSEATCKEYFFYPDP